MNERGSLGKIVRETNAILESNVIKRVVGYE